MWECGLLARVSRMLRDRGMTEKLRISVTINGEVHDALVEPRRLLVDFLGPGMRKDRPPQW